MSRPGAVLTPISVWRPVFTCGVASLANIGGSASAPILAGAYSGALVPVGVLMALMGYVIGTAGGLITANIMSLLA